MRVLDDLDPRHDALGNRDLVPADRKADDLNLVSKGREVLSVRELKRLVPEKPTHLHEREVAAVVHGTDHGVHLLVRQLCASLDLDLRTGLNYSFGTKK